MIVIGFQSCDKNSNPIDGGITPEPELFGCEGANVYDWDTVEFATSLDGGADAWIAFSLEELTLFTVVINQPGFQCTVYNGCEGEVGLDPPLFQFETIGNGYEIGIVPEGDYWVKILNTRPNRMDFTFKIELDDIVYGCMNNDALNYNDEANVDDGSCEFNNCTTEYFTSNYGDMVLDCDGNCSPISWIGDGFCDDGAYGIQDEEGNVIPINLWCEEFNFDEGDCEVIPGECTEGLIEDCNGICAPENWLGDGFCDDGSYEYNGNPIFFNCEEFGNDNGDCDVQGRTTQIRPYPNGKIKIK
tara:strand:+ start:39 stop:941 length:903 start_codon:yes stop_codon:yes gene_type:complete